MIRSIKIKKWVDGDEVMDEVNIISCHLIIKLKCSFWITPDEHNISVTQLSETDVMLLCDYKQYGTPNNPLAIAWEIVLLDRILSDLTNL